MFIGAGGERYRGTVLGSLLDRLNSRSCIVIVVVLLLAAMSLDHDWFCHHSTGNDRTIVVAVVALVVRVIHACLSELGRCNGRHCRCIRRSDDGRLVSRLVAVNADHGGAGKRGLLGRDGADNGIVAIRGGGHTAAQARRNSGRTAATVVRQVGEGRVTQVARHEEVLVGGRPRKRGNGRDERRGSVGRRTIGDTRDVGDLDDIGGTGEDGRSDGVGRFSGLLGCAPTFLLAGTGTSQTVLVALLPDEEPPEQTSDNGDKGDTTDDTTRNGTGIAAAAAAGRLVVGTATGGSLNTLGCGALIAGLTDHGASGAFVACRAGWGGRLTFDAAFED